ncbi:helix-turn-helix domain-containing protein [Streptomyces uncialis]|uniref:helix-turn-helix domain-containing protein n=1 Tax=Streptomyces uncialis TaxID=1048205 RepID=UPI0037F820C1
MDAPLMARCACCDTEFPLRPGPGRPKSYCTVACRSRSQRQRDRHRETHPQQTTDTAEAESGRRILGQVLAAARSERGLDLPVIAVRTGLPPQTVRLVLTGAATCTWGETRRLAHVLSVRSGEVQHLWESAQGLPRAGSGPGFGAAVTVLRDALAGLHRAAGRPTAEALAHTTGLHAPTVAAILRGDWAPDWQATALLAAALGAQPALLRPLWERLHYAFLTSPDQYPHHGTPTRPARDRPPTPPAFVREEEASRGRRQPPAPPPRPR